MPSILRTPISRKFHNYTGDVITQGSVTIVTASTGSVPVGSTATVYSSETGIGVLSQPLSLQSDGGVNGWLEIGIYDMTAVTSIGTVTSRYYVNHPEQSILQGTALTDNQFQINDDNDTYSRFNINSGGTVSWGGGSASTDTYLYRAGSNSLQTSGTFTAGTVFTTGLIVDSGTVNGAWVNSGTLSFNQGGSITVTSTRSKYQKIGRNVTLSFKYTITSAGTSGSAIAILISSLPYTPADATNGIHGYAMYNTGATRYTGVIAPLNSGTLNLFASGNLTGIGQTPAFATANGNTIEGMIVYESLS